MPNPRHPILFVTEAILQQKRQSTKVNYPGHGFDFSPFAFPLKEIVTTPTTTIEKVDAHFHLEITSDLTSVAYVHVAFTKNDQVLVSQIYLIICSIFLKC